MVSVVVIEFSVMRCQPFRRALCRVVLSMESKISFIEHKTYTEIIFDGYMPQKIEQYERFNTDKFISILDLPSKYTYTENFKNRLHKLSIDGIVRPESFSLQLKNELKGM
ncbi:hypothetical protein KPM64_003579, partial [Vibrio cholerae]|nr:hypothetical protein [Vibrio cholerae]